MSHKSKKEYALAQGKLACPLAISSRLSLGVILYRRSAIITGWAKGQSNHRPFGECSTRNKITDLSNKSATRLLFIIKNAPLDWGVMVTLTYRQTPTDVKQAMRKWTRLMQKQGLCQGQWLWVMEFQQRGCVHYHVLFARQELERAGFLRAGMTEQIVRHGQTTTLVRGGFERRVIDCWTASVGDRSDEFRAFQEGGICEILGSKEAASRYFGAYFGKRDQKIIPKGMEGAGRWWYASPACQPEPIAHARLSYWPLLFPTGCVYDYVDIADAIQDVKYFEAKTDVKQSDTVKQQKTNEKHS